MEPTPQLQKSEVPASKVMVMERPAAVADSVICSSREEWLLERMKAVGGSEAASILGENPWCSALEVWATKCGLAESDAENEAMLWGTKLEPVVRAHYTEVTGRAVQFQSPFQIWKHPRVKSMAATLDGEILHAEGKDGSGVLECKAVGARKAADWENGPPRHYWIQMQHQLAVTGRKWGSFAVLIGGQKFIWCDVNRDDAFIAELERRCEAFWEQVEGRVSPAAGEGVGEAAILAAMYPTDLAPVHQAPPEMDDVAWQLRDVRREMKKLSETEERLENQLKQAIADAAGVKGPGYRVTWKADKVGKVAWAKVAAELSPPAELVAKYTGAPGRRFLFTTDEE